MRNMQLQMLYFIVLRLKYLTNDNYFDHPPSSICKITSFQIFARFSNPVFCVSECDFIIFQLHFFRIAVLLARVSSSSTYYKTKGKHEMLIRQLELLDYKVIVVDKKVWNSMYMSEPFAKENYLCSLIWPR